MYSVTIPSGVTSIGSYAFYGCTYLTSVTIPSSVTSIADYTFAGCWVLTGVIIPSSVTSIGTEAFAYCSALASVTIQPTVPPSLPSGSKAFLNCAAGLQIHVPSGTIASYEVATGWSDYYSPTNYFTSP